MSPSKSVHEELIAWAVDEFFAEVSEVISTEPVNGEMGSPHGELVHGPQIGFQVNAEGLSTPWAVGIF